MVFFFNVCIDTCVFYLSTLLSQINLTFYGIPHINTINIHVHEHIIIEQMYGLNIERDI
jgi:hypothetical protein